MGKPLRIGTGKPGPGRPKGLPNKTTTAAKEAFALAFNKLGGWEALADWASLPQNRGEFYKLYARLIPVDLTSGGDKIPAPIIQLAHGEPQPKAD